MPHYRVVIEFVRLDAIVESTVMAAALSVCRPHELLGFAALGVPEPRADLADVIARAAARLHPTLPMPRIELLGEQEAAHADADLHVKAGLGASEDARAVAEIAALAAAEAEVTPLTYDSSLRTNLDVRGIAIAARDRASAGTTPTIVVVAQVQSTWPAVETVCAELASRDDVRLEIVAIESEHDVRGATTASFVTTRGYTPRDVGWLETRLADPTSDVSAIIFYDPWDGLRPFVATAAAAMESGVRIVYFPYSPNAAADDKMLSMSYDLPMHRYAWRVYARSQQQRRLFARHCGAGAAHVRVLGTPKIDRLLSGKRRRTAWSTKVRGRPVVLWNPHFSFGDGGWSTFLDYLDAMLSYAAEHPGVFLLIRPHFRVLRDLALSGDFGVQLIARLESAAEWDNVAIDRGQDYLDAFAWADAMISDLSSLITEFFVSGKPILYLFKEGGPPLNEDAAYFLACDVAMSWEDVQRFLDSVEARQDDGRPRRELAVRFHFPWEDGASAGRIVDDIVGSLTEERAAG